MLEVVRNSGMVSSFGKVEQTRKDSERSSEATHSYLHTRTDYSLRSLPCPHPEPACSFTRNSHHDGCAGGLKALLEGEDGSLSGILPEKLPLRKNPRG